MYTGVLYYFGDNANLALTFKSYVYFEVPLSLFPLPEAKRLGDLRSWSHHTVSERFSPQIRGSRQAMHAAFLLPGHEFCKISILGVCE